MIFQKEHIDMIIAGTKTQTRRIHRGKYQVGRSYAIQSCRTCKGIKGYRIVMDRIWHEDIVRPLSLKGSPAFNIISVEDAKAEGGYSPAEFEILFRKLNPSWDETRGRWAFEFHVIEACSQI